VTATEREPATQQVEAEERQRSSGRGRSRLRVASEALHPAGAGHAAGRHPRLNGHAEALQPDVRAGIVSPYDRVHEHRARIGIAGSTARKLASSRVDQPILTGRAEL